MTLYVDWDVKHQFKQTNKQSNTTHNWTYVSFRWFGWHRYLIFLVVIVSAFAMSIIILLTQCEGSVEVVSENSLHCRCQTPCNSNCVNGTCYKNETCQAGCNINTWGPDCGQTCNANCVDAPDNTTSKCDRDGVCLYGCKLTFMGPTCSESCPTNCISNDCNATTGHCLQGCKKDYWNDLCNTNCSTNCLQFNGTTCHRDNGTCIQGCIEDHYGPFCDQGCPLNCFNDTCQRYNGTCSLGCTKGFAGEYCNLSKHFVAKTCPCNAQRGFQLKKKQNKKKKKKQKKQKQKNTKVFCGFLWVHVRTALF